MIPHESFLLWKHVVAPTSLKDKQGSTWALGTLPLLFSNPQNGACHVLLPANEPQCCMEAQCDLAFCPQVA